MPAIAPTLARRSSKVRLSPCVRYTAWPSLDARLSCVRYTAWPSLDARLSLAGNVFRELGIHEKQSSAVFLAKSFRTTIRRNVMFNLPRAAININDGAMGGHVTAGHRMRDVSGGAATPAKPLSLLRRGVRSSLSQVIEQNVIFHSCRESGDHGAINSWDRQPFLHDESGSPSYTPWYALPFLSLIIVGSAPRHTRASHHARRSGRYRSATTSSPPPMAPPRAVSSLGSWTAFPWPSPLPLLGRGRTRRP